MTKDREFWSETSDSHEKIIAEFKLHEGAGRVNFVRFEISPDNDNLSIPIKDWKYKLDENGPLPEWYNSEDAEKRARVMLKHWAESKLTGWNVKEAFNPIHPLELIAKKMSRKRAMSLTAKWAYVGDSVRDSVWDSVGTSVGDSVRDSVWDSVWDSVRTSVRTSVRDSVGDSVWDSVGDSVWAYVGSLFIPRITTWKYAKKLAANPWKELRELWVSGYVPSFDGTTWRLHSGKTAKVAFDFTVEEILHEQGRK
jgi:hypothetical protein